MKILKKEYNIRLIMIFELMGNRFCNFFPKKESYFSGIIHFFINHARRVHRPREYGRLGAPWPQPWSGGMQGDAA